MMLEQQIKEAVNKKIASEGDSRVMSGCIPVLLKAASFGKASKKNLINACIAAEYFYQALHHHYWQGRGVGSDVIMGDYYGSLAIIYASKLQDTTVLRTFCQAIQAATNDEEKKNKGATRLAKIYGASSYVGAYLAGLSGNVLDDFYKQGEKDGLKELNAKPIVAKN